MFWAAAGGEGFAADARLEIAQARASSNAGIAAHDPVEATRALGEDAVVIGSGGSVLQGAQAMRQAFGKVFSEPRFVTYVRRLETVEIEAGVAAEHGHWTGVWRDQTIEGAYLARWARTQTGWRIRSELYIPLTCRGAACAQ